MTPQFLEFLTPEERENLRICEAATPGPWTADISYSPIVWGKTAAGDMRIADIRGWGHLTGGGALALPEDQASAIQDANAQLIAIARTALPAAYRDLAEARKRIAELEAGVTAQQAEIERLKAEATVECPTCGPFRKYEGKSVGGEIHITDCTQCHGTGRINALEAEHRKVAEALRELESSDTESIVSSWSNVGRAIAILRGEK